ncbi:MAG TPA: NUDIX hydrolase [Blastocatellia bacterium]|nr:NUDIX hydrolase [Blastocatellia bacterium]
MNRAKTPRKHCYDHPRPAVTVDIVLFHRSKRGNRVLLIQRKREPFKGRWAFPGGFVDENESLEAAASRELFEETGIDCLELKQIGAFGDPERDPRGHTVSIAFAAVLEDQHEPVAGDDAKDARWCAVSKHPPLAFDHGEILRAACKRILGNRARPKNR